MRKDKPIVEDFIKGAKASKAETTETEPESAPSPALFAMTKSDVTFPLRIPKEMHTKWKKFAHKAERSLHSFIFAAVQEKIASMEKDK